jgi:hypothetical protein
MSKHVAIEARFDITEDLCQRVYQLTANGLSKPDVAGCLSISEKTLNKLIRRHPALRKAIFDGRYFGLQNATGRLRALMDQGNPAAIMFYLKTRWVWRERDKQGKDGDLQSDKKQDKIEFKSMSATDAARIYQQVMKGTK